MSIYNEIKRLLEDGSSKLFLALCVASLVGANANAAATYTTEDNGATLVVTVDADGATLDAGQIGGGVTLIKKAGPGKLTSVDISSYTGDFDIEEGIWCCTDAKQFGAASKGGRFRYHLRSRRCIH